MDGELQAADCKRKFHGCHALHKYPEMAVKTPAVWGHQQTSTGNSEKDSHREEKADS